MSASGQRAPDGALTLHAAASKPIAAASSAGRG
jgi:hypothetical protein